MLYVSYAAYLLYWRLLEDEEEQRDKKNPWILKIHVSELQVEPIHKHAYKKKMFDLKLLNEYKQPQRHTDSCDLINRSLKPARTRAAGGGVERSQPWASRPLPAKQMSEELQRWTMTHHLHVVPPTASNWETVHYVIFKQL